MAVRERIVHDVLDDFDLESPATTREFTFNGSPYQIDLTDENYESLQGALSTWEEANRTMQAFMDRARMTQDLTNEYASELTSEDTPATTPKRRRRTTSKKKQQISDKEIRAWAQTNGIEVAPTGRLSRSIRDQYMTAMA